MNASPQRPTRETSSTLVDSPWFWVVCFAAIGLLATTVIDRKYGERQATIERKYQARGQVQRDIAAGRPVDQTAESDEGRELRYSTPDETLISLGPVRAILVAAMLIAAGVLTWQRRPWQWRSTETGEGR